MVTFVTMQLVSAQQLQAAEAVTTRRPSMRPSVVVVATPPVTVSIVDEHAACHLTRHYDCSDAPGMSVLRGR